MNSKNCMKRLGVFKFDRTACNDLLSLTIAGSITNGARGTEKLLAVFEADLSK